MRFQLSIDGKLLSVLPVHVTPVDVKIANADLNYADWAVKTLNGIALNFPGFRGSLIAKVF